MVKVFWNPGHGGSDPGAVANGLKEKDLVLKIAKKADKYLKDNYEGATTKIFRSNDTFKSLNAIASEANKWNADIFVSIHINAGGGTGFESHIYNGPIMSKTKANQNIIHAEIMRNLKGFADRGKKQKNLAVLRQTTMAALLTENGFIDTKSDADKLKQDSFLNALAKGHADGVAKVLGLKRKVKKEDKPVSKPKKENNTPDPSHATAWKKAQKKIGKDGKPIMDGTRPQEPITREQHATTLYRLGLLD